MDGCRGQNAPDQYDPEIPENRALSCTGLRYGLLAFGWLCVGLGVVGMLLPVMPTTIFLILALWAFSKSSLRFHAWLYRHPRLGRTLRAWHRHRVIPLPAKCLAVTMMSASLLYVTLFVAQGWLLPALLGLTLASVAAYILTRPHRIPVASPASL